MQYFDLELLKNCICNQNDYQLMIENMKNEAQTLLDNFNDDVNHISGWGHAYFCQEDGGRLIYDKNKPHSHVCEICGNEYHTQELDNVWVTHYRNDVITNIWKSAVIYKVTGEKKYLDYVINILEFYADNYQAFPLHNKEGVMNNHKIWGNGKLMPQGLNEAIIMVRVVNALEVVKEDLPLAFLEKIHDKLFTGVFEILKPQVDKIHNISCWLNSAIGCMGLFSQDQAMIDYAFLGEYNIRRQLKEGVTEDSFWYEGSIHYNFFTLEGVTNLLMFSKLYNYAFGDEEKTVEKMLVSAYNFAFDNHIFPNPNDGWPNINLKTYSYIYNIATKVFGEYSTVGNLLKNIIQNDLPRGMLPLSRPYYFENRISLEQMLFNPNLKVNDYTVVKSTSHNFETSFYGILRENGLNIFYKYGHRGRSHAHFDKMNIEVMIGNETLSRDLSNSGYRSRLCNEWQRLSVSHNTVVVDFKNHESYAGGDVLKYNEHTLHALVQDVYKGVDYIRKIDLVDNGFNDTFEVISNEEHTYDYFFHSEAKLITELNLAEATLGSNENGYQHIKNVRKVITDENSLTLTWKLGQYTLYSTIDLQGKELFITKTYDNPVTKYRTTLILRSKAQNALYTINWKVIGGENMVQNYFFYNESKFEDLGAGQSRRILAYNDSLMAVEVSFEEGAIGALHTHQHEQVTYVLEGEFELMIGDKKKIIKKGDTVYEQPNIIHGCVCLKAGKLLDIFTPKREDFLNK